MNTLERQIGSAGRNEGSFAAAVRQMAAARVLDQRRRHSAARFRRALAVTDALIEELEALNLGGRRRLTNAFRERILADVEHMPHELELGYRDTILVQRALDQVFDLQEGLLRMQNPAVAEDDDESWEHPAAS